MAQGFADSDSLDVAGGDNFLFDVFLSYRRSDGSRFARRFRRRLLAAHRRLPEQAVPLRVYLDRIQARADLDFYTETIRPALLASRWLIVVATPEAAQRPVGETDWIAREIGEFISRRGIERIRVVHAAGKILPDMPHDLVARMDTAQQIDLRRLFGLVPGTRAQEDWESLLATLFDLGPDQMPQLRREEERLQRIRLSRLAGGVAGAAVFATGLSGFAIYRTAESHQNVERAAAVLSANLDPYQTGACDALDALWSNGATRRAISAMRCHIARADFHWLDDDRDRARAEMGSWDDFFATLPDRGLDLLEELAHARHLFERSLIEYDHFDATGQWFGAEQPLPAEGRTTALLAIDEVERSLGEIEGLDAARETLSDVLWPLLYHLENTGETNASRALMMRAARLLEPHAAFSMNTYATPDDPWLVDYGLLARRIASFAREDGDLDDARDWSGKAVTAFGAFTQTEPWTLYQHGLARMVRAQTLEAAGQEPRQDYSKALHLMRKAIEVADPSWEGLAEISSALEYVDGKLIP